jgi:hypothetical protein
MGAENLFLHAQFEFHMKYIIKALILSILSLLLTGCTTIFLVLIGGKKPEIETMESIKKYGAKWNIKADSIYLLKDDYVLTQLSRPSNELLLFDNEGYSIDLTKVGEDPRCGSNIYGLYRGLGKITYAKRDSSRTLLNEIQKAFHLETNAQLELDTKNDYFIVFYWNCFMGKERNKEEIVLLKKVIAENPRIKTQLILINSDMYEGVDWEQKLKQEKAMVSP